MLNSRDAALLYRLHLANYESMESIAMSRQDRARMIDYLATYYSIHLPKFPTLQSLQILQEVMSV